MTAETAVQNFEKTFHLYENICLYCGIAAVVFLLLSVVLFVMLRIPQVFGEITGRTARRAVRQMADGNTGIDKSAAGEKIPGARSYYDLDGKNDTPASLVVQDDVVTPTVMQTPGVLPGAAQPEETETSVLEQDTAVLQEPCGERRSGFVILRSIVEVHADEVIEK